MTSNLEAITTQPQAVSTKSCTEVSNEEQTRTTDTSNDMKTSEKHPENVLSEQSEINKSESSSNETQQNSTTNDQKATIESSQHQITTIEEESDRDENNAETINQRSYSEIHIPEAGNDHFDTDREDMEEKKGCCSECCTDVFYCTLWYCRNVKNFMTTCFTRCDCKRFFCNNESNSEEPEDGNYVYSDLNETFSNEIGSDDTAINSFEVIHATASSDTNHYSSRAEHDGGYHNSGVDVTCDNSGGDAGWSSGGDGGGDCGGGDGGGSCD